ncbi:Khdc3 [Symbiodinium sp. CCMP2456]|nr:Khdc3 [Symbiodinium sp. CCMP2456]
MQEWWDVKGEIKRLPADYVPENVFKVGLAPSPLRSLSDDPKKIRVDAAHTWAINGIGKDLYSSSLVLGARMGFFGAGSMDARLKVAYSRFDKFCKEKKKYTSIDAFNFMYTTFPAGLGKGHDCAIVGAWLESELWKVDAASIESKYVPLFDAMRFTVDATGKFWRCIYNHGMWIPRSAAHECCKNGWLVAVPWL